ncbi:hypothetical protein EMGBS11_02220 [Actinomycetota bacterium]|nr:hypothetical protein EMGBS11_02220 [Actinomycetota bacterium]
MSNPRPGPDEFDEEELIRSEFDSIVSALSLDESAPTTYLDELDAIQDSNRFIPPNPPRQSPRAMWRAIKGAVNRWFHRGYHEDDGAAL